jgi:hypothetical protein
MAGMDWIDLAQDRDRGWVLAKAVMTFGVNTMLGISTLTEELLVSQEGLCSMDFVCLSVCLFLCYLYNFHFLYLRIQTM